MEALVPYATWAVLILVGLGLLAIVLFGIRNLTYGKVSPVTMVTVIIPVLLFGILGFVMGDWAIAGIWTFLVMLGLTSLTLLLSSVRGFIG